VYFYYLCKNKICRWLIIFASQVLVHLRIGLKRDPLFILQLQYVILRKKHGLKLCGYAKFILNWMTYKKLAFVSDTVLLDIVGSILLQYLIWKPWNGILGFSTLITTLLQKTDLPLLIRIWQSLDSSQKDLVLKEWFLKFKLDRPNCTF